MLLPFKLLEQSIIIVNYSQIKFVVFTFEKNINIQSQRGHSRKSKIGTRRSACGFSYPNEKLLPVFE